MENPASGSPATASSTDANLQLVRRVYEEGLNKGDLAVLDQLIDAKLVDHSLYPGSGSGRDMFKERFNSVRRAFPDASMTIEDSMSAGDRVVCRWTLRGTHTGGPFVSVAPTGRHVVVSGINISRIEQGKLVEHWSSFDHLGLLQQLGVMTPYQVGRGGPGRAVQ